ncbi:hypothetical protein DESA109040_22800 [Deinococcus saxicola]
MIAQHGPHLGIGVLGVGPVQHNIIGEKRAHPRCHSIHPPAGVVVVDIRGGLKLCFKHSYLHGQRAAVACQSHSSLVDCALSDTNARRQFQDTGQTALRNALLVT